MSDVLVLCYHAVSPTWSARLSVTPEALEWQLKTLIRRGWRGATFTEAVLDPPWQRTLAVTFDDAYLSVLERALPLMSELKLVGTLFAPTDFMDKRQPLGWTGIDHWAQTADAPELQSMNWDDLRRLLEAGWEVGSHTGSHARLTRLDDGALQDELERSQQCCTERLGRPCRSIAYPYGDTDERVARAAQRAGYQCGASLSSSLTPLGPHRWPRVGVYQRDQPWRFWLKVNGLVRRARAMPAWPAHA
jgi:peptidoglycan/xylan/chitin deacetylase (PgdA/CDA1 family)